jgi:hypothetical protein
MKPRHQRLKLVKNRQTVNLLRSKLKEFEAFADTDPRVNKLPCFAVDTPAGIAIVVVEEDRLWLSVRKAPAFHEHQFQVTADGVGSLLRQLHQYHNISS